jgi:isoquinoline 1-oxidoreductase subunit beta
MTYLSAKKIKVSRRGFLAGSAGLTFAVAISPKGASLIGAAEARTTERNVGAWVRITPDNNVTIITPAAEMGQGSMTGVPTILAEELDADWDKVTLEMAPAEPKVYGYTMTRRGRSRKLMGIFGSHAIAYYYNDMRIAGAQVRKVLISAAAKKWRVSKASLTTEPGLVVHKSSGRKMTYGEISAFADVPATMPTVAKFELKKKSQFRLIGKSVPRRDIPEKVDGSAKFAIDVHLPGLVYAGTLHAPVQQASPQSWNDAEIKAMRGVIDVVPVSHGVAVVADTFEHVLAAKSELKVVWAKDAKAEGYDSEAFLEDTYAKVADSSSAPSKTVKEKGDVGAAFSKTTGGKIFRREFRSDYGYHAQMEPLNAVARFNDAGDGVEVWEGTQAPGISRRYIARALGLKTSQVDHHQMYLGGGFGRRSISDYTVEAAVVARQVKRPVKMIWTREDDIAYGMFRPQTYQCVEAALDASGKIAGWKHCVVGDGPRLTVSGIKLDRYYGIPNQLIERRGQSHGIRLKHWRAVAHPFNIFAIESVVDEMAESEGLDPLEFRRQRMAMNAKAKRVFDKVAEMSKWGDKRPKDRAVGLSVSERSGSLGAGVVEISLDEKTGKIRVHKVWAAIDGGTIVQPDMARRNIESGMIYGISSILKERVTIKNGVVEQSNFHDYEVLRMSEAPEELHVQFIDRSTKPTGLGEIGNPFIGAAIANAFNKITGKRLTHMPFTPERVLKVLKG